jgi:hypothetical protein
MPIQSTCNHFGPSGQAIKQILSSMSTLSAVSDLQITVTRFSMLLWSLSQSICKVDGLHPHLVNKMADARYSLIPREVMVFHPAEGESCSVPDRLNT